MSVCMSVCNLFTSPNEPNYLAEMSADNLDLGINPRASRLLHISNLRLYLPVIN